MRWRAWIAAYALAALAWPSIGPLPWLFDDQAEAAQADVAAEGRHHRDASDIPGSPTHPADHDCFQCEVIKHLARCIPGDTVTPFVAPLSGTPPQPLISFASFDRVAVATRPPIRAPPSSSH